MKRLAAMAAVLLALGAFIYFRPLSVYFAARSVYLRAIGVQSQFVTVAGHRIHYMTVGEGPPLVLVHGVAMRGADWTTLLRPLAKRHRLYVIDLLGYGQSDKPRDGDYSIATQAEILRGFLDALALRKPDIAGVSMGGWIALTLASREPERVNRLVLISSAGLPFPHQLTETTFSATTVEEQRRSFALQSEIVSRLPDFILRDFIRHSRKKAWVVRRSMRSMLERHDLLLHGRLERVRMPVLIVAGTADRIVPFDVALRLQQEMPQARIVALEGCGHLAAFECRKETLQAMEAFLRP